MAVLAAPVRAFTPAAIELAQALVGRTLRRAEQAIDVLRLDQALNRAKDELEAAIRAEMLAATVAWKLGGAVTPGLRVTETMLAVLARLAELGRQEALLELGRLGYSGVRDANERRFVAQPGPRPGQTAAGYLTSELPHVQTRIVDELVTVDLSAASQTAVAQALLRVPGARDIASRVISTALMDGMGLTFDEHADLIRCWEYTAVLDAGTCARCAPLDGKRYDSLQALFADLPNFGPNPHCRGGGRCRCRAVPCAVDDVGQNVAAEELEVVVSPVTDVATLLVTPTRGKLKETADEVAGAIAKVHALPADVAPIKLVRNATTSRQGSYRYYEAGSRSLGASRARQEAFDIQISSKASDPAGTLAHEIGHWIDDQAIGRLAGAKGSAVLGDAEETRALMATIRGSEAYRRLEYLRDDPAARVPIIVNGAELESRVDRTHVRYLISDHELFARAYAQYVATRGGSDVLRAEITRVGRRYPYQWAEDDFAPIAAAFDELFRRLGWSKS